MLMGEYRGRQLSAAGNIPFQQNEGSSRVAGVLPESSELVCWEESGGVVLPEGEAEEQVVQHTWSWWWW